MRMRIHFAEPLHAKCAESRLGEVRSEASTRRVAPGGAPARPGGLYRGSRIGPVRSAWSAKRRDTSNCTYRKEAPEREAGRRRASKERATRTDTRKRARLSSVLALFLAPIHRGAWKEHPRSFAPRGFWEVAQVVVSKSSAFREQPFPEARIHDPACDAPRSLPGTPHRTARHGSRHYI